MSHILVTGATGFIGRVLSDFLLVQGHSLVTLGRSGAPFRSQGERHVQLDLSRDDLSLLSNERFDAVFHLASSANVRLSVEDPVADFDAGVLSTLRLLDFVRRTSPAAVFVFASTVSVVSDKVAKPISESAQVEPTSPYGAGKAAGEGYCAAFHKTYGLDTRIVRLFNVYGPSCHRLFLWDIFRKFQENPRCIKLMGDGSQVRDYVHVLDVAEAFYTVLTRGGSGETYNCCSGEPVRLDQLVDWVAEAMGILAFSKELLPTYPGDIHEWYGDGGKLANLGFVPRIALGQGIKETVRSYLNATR